MKLFRTATGLVVQDNDHYYSSSNISLDTLLTRDDLEEHLSRIVRHWTSVDESALTDLRAPIGSQEVWCAGVTYYRSRTARMAESPAGGSFYDKVYDADRPELFFKATSHRVLGHQQKVAIRSDAKWSVPEPELTLLISPNAKI